jgi:hypothetical protein
MMPPQKMKHFSGTPVLTSIAKADLSARSVPTKTFSSEKASRNGCNGRQKGGFPAAGSFAIASRGSSQKIRLQSKLLDPGVSG